MPIKDIVTLVELKEPRHTVQFAVDLAARTGAHLTGIGLSYEPVVAGYLIAPMPADYLDEARKRSIHEARTALDSFTVAASRAGISHESRQTEMPGDGMTGPFVEQTRISDLIVIGQDDPEHRDPMRSALIEAALFESGVPVLIVPYTGATSFSPDHVMIAWDGSRTAMRAVHAALPMLELSNKISIVIVGKRGARNGQPGGDLATYLSRHGHKVSIELVASPETSIADALLNFASDNAVDLAVMGGYGHSRMREFILGGVTNDMLKSLTVPVLMAH